MGTYKRMKTPPLIKKLVHFLPFVHPYLEKRAYKREIEGSCRWILNDVLERAKAAYEKERPVCATWEDYEKAYHRYHVEYSEYFHQYEYWKLSEEERARYVVRTPMRLFYLRTIPKRVRYMFWDKEQFLQAFPEHIHRRWLVARKATREEFENLVRACDCMAKPLAASFGEGIFKIHSSDIEDVGELYARCVEGNMLIEECIRGCDALQQFHPQSLNSIRVVTIGNSKAGEVFGAFLRMGVGGSVVDNAHAGGLFATIDVASGRVVTEGINTDGGRYAIHPDTGIPIKGFQIPEWGRIQEVCLQAARKYKGVFIVGWDVVIDALGNVVFVEGNHGPDFDVMQSPFKIGIRRELQAVFHKYHGKRYIIP